MATIKEDYTTDEIIRGKIVYRTICKYFPEEKRRTFKDWDALEEYERRGSIEAAKDVVSSFNFEVF